MCSEPEPRGRQGEAGVIAMGGREVSKSTGQCKYNIKECWQAQRFEIHSLNTRGESTLTLHSPPHLTSFDLTIEKAFQHQSSVSFCLSIAGDCPEPREPGLPDRLQGLSAHSVLCQVRLKRMLIF